MVPDPGRAARRTAPGGSTFCDLNTGKQSEAVGLLRVSLAVLLVIGAAALGVMLARHASGQGPGPTPAAAAAAPAEQHATTCKSRLLHDWEDGRIDGVYPVSCYRAALRSLPTDLEVYSSAHDDIAQALTNRIVQSHHGQKISGHQGTTSVRKVESAR
jgi:hypothetical protein